ncbi:hypothetical protein PHMEG_00034710 [Phytophthora megakarya]|uniref:Reverse transcriptase n=1 Tax=Phytophthora megakarya TaxID=4795 RepID=A0A225UQA8_9STRA|nr:hypothetical protein PHMEG_00034710 [Phytophthora megakarya]
MSMPCMKRTTSRWRTFAQELAFLPDLTEPSVPELDYTVPNLKNPSFAGDQQQRLDEVFKKHEAIMILSGNALPPLAYGVVCDIDVQGHAPIKQRARRIPLRHLQKPNELLKGLLKGKIYGDRVREIEVLETEQMSDSKFWSNQKKIILKMNLYTISNLQNRISKLGLLPHKQEPDQIVDIDKLASSRSRTPHTSPIVIVLKKNGQDIRLCINYKMANAVTAIMEYAVPLVDDLLTELENYLWFCSLDAASGFWAS